MTHLIWILAFEHTKSQKSFSEHAFQLLVHFLRSQLSVRHNLLLPKSLFSAD
jgi:hypothetical protein